MIFWQAAKPPCAEKTTAKGDELEKAIEGRDQVIGEMTSANRGFKKLSGQSLSTRKRDRRSSEK